MGCKWAQYLSTFLHANLDAKENAFIASYCLFPDVINVYVCIPYNNEN